ncbi:MAG TPA: hypothetical protein PJ988_18105, partial [Anaerolinea sp.]|nr:hypothetical protein [Anaerolinea sp.]
AEEQVFGVLPGLDDNSFENDFVDHGSLLIVVKTKRPGRISSRSVPANVYATDIMLFLVYIK